LVIEKYNKSRMEGDYHVRYREARGEIPLVYSTTKTLAIIVT